MKKIFAVLLSILLLLGLSLAAQADGEPRETVTIVNCDRANVRDADGRSIGRLVCYTPITTHEVKDDMTYITFPKALFEIWKDEFTLKEYGDTYTGVAGGWIRTACLSESYMDGDTLYHMAEDCRWELWVDGIYHQLHSYGLSRNKNFDTHAIPTVDGKQLNARTNYRDLANWNNASTVIEDKGADWQGSWRISDYGSGVYYVEYTETRQGVTRTVRGYFDHYPTGLDELRNWAGTINN